MPITELSNNIKYAVDRDGTTKTLDNRFARGRMKFAERRLRLFAQTDYSPRIYDSDYMETHSEQAVWHRFFAILSGSGP
jgi:hypothetical protein